MKRAIILTLLLLAACRDEVPSQSIDEPMPSASQVRQAITDYLLQSFSDADVRTMELSAPKKHIGMMVGDITAWLVCARNKRDVTAFFMLGGKVVLAAKSNADAREVYCKDAKYSSHLH